MINLGRGKRVYALALLALALAPLWAFAGKPRKWAHEESQLEPDPSIVWGSLDNGFRYALKQHDSRPGIVSMRLLVEVGSLDEQDDERGLAHFIEHMAFEGTRNFKPGELIEFFQKLGMGYGIDVNAFTYHDKTVYHLELPQNDGQLVQQGLKLFRDYADGILFDPARVENERGVIMREKQARESPSSRISQAAFQFSFDGMKLAERNPIGLNWVVQGVSVEQLKSFYEKWYRPDLMTLVVVGDFEVEEFEREIESAFSSLEAPRQKIPKRKIGRLSRSPPFRAGHLDVEGVERYTLEVSRTWMERDGKDSWNRRELDTLRSFATSLFNERCRELIDGMSDNFANYNRIYGVPYCQLTISSGGDFWWDAFVWMDQLLRQALTYGFTQQELDYLRKTWLQANRSAVSRYQSAEPRMLIDELVESIAHGRVYVDTEVFAERLGSFVENLSLREVNLAFADIWELKRLSYFMAGNFEQTLGSQDLKRRLLADRRHVVLPYVPRRTQDFLYSEYGAPGTVVESGSLQEIGAKTYRFSNNARLSFLKTDNEKDTVRALVRVGGGMLAFHDNNPATHVLAMNSLFRSSFGGHDIEDVYRELRSNLTSFIFGVEDHDAFTYRGEAPSDGLDEFFKIVAEYLLNPQIDEDAFALSRSKLIQSRELEPDGMSEGYRTLYRILYPDMPRFHFPSIGEIGEVESDTIRDWLETPLKEGYLEVAVVGDIEESELLELFGQTIGALPLRRETKQEFASARSLKIEAAKGRKKIEYRKGMGDNAASVIVWTIQDKITLRESASLYVLASVLESRIRERVREEMGASYSPSVRYVTFPAYETLRHIRADVDCLKGDADEVLDVVLEIASSVTDRAVSEDELRAAVAPLEEGLKQAWSDNSYLLENVLYGVQEYPAIVENAIKYREGLLSSLTVDELQAVALKYLSADQALAVSIVPSETSKLAEAPAGETQHRAGASR